MSLWREKEIMDLSNFRLRILSIVFIISPIVFLTWYSYVFALLAIFTISFLIVYELISNQSKNQKIIYGLIAGIISIFPFVINSYYDSVTNIQNNIFYIISMLIILLFFILHIPKKSRFTSIFKNNLSSVLFGSIVSTYFSLIIILSLIHI